MKLGTRLRGSEVGGQIVVRNGLGKKILSEQRFEGVEELVI